MSTHREILEYYARPSAITSVGKHGGRLETLPNDVAALARVVPGLVLYEYVASDFYGLTIPDERKDETHIRKIEEMLDRIVDLDDRPLDVARPLDKRLVGI